MGGCCSKNDLPSHPIPKSIASHPQKEDKAAADAPIVAAPLPTAVKFPVFTTLVKPATKSPASSQDVGSDTSRKGETPKKKKAGDERRGEENDGLARPPSPAPAPAAPAAVPVRSSNCSREEVDAILIQCGHLSRNSSGKATANERRYSGSKRSFDFDDEERRRPAEGEEAEKQVLKPSPRRRTPARDGGGGGGDHKRSGSREKGNGGSGGGRRVSRSPGRRSDDPGSADASKQPAKMVLVPARERGSSSSSASATMESNGERTMTSNNSADSRPRSHSLRRSRSPANTRGPSNENSSSHHSLKKTEQSPHRRNPMAELDKNASKPENNHHHHHQRKPISQVKPQKPSQGIDYSKTAVKAIAAAPLVDEAQGGNSRSSVRTPSRKRTPSGDFDTPHSNPELWASSDSHIVSLNLGNPSSHNSFIYYNGVEENASFSPPPCVSKARSILEAVAGLNSSFSDNRLRLPLVGKRGEEEPFMVSEIGVEEDLMEPSLHKYVTLRSCGVGEVEPQESAGSNNVAGQSWEASPWGHNSSIDSSSMDRCWTSRSKSNNNNGGEFEGREVDVRPNCDHLKLLRRSPPAAVASF